jgi:(1->4)-alpha-D-glucan 1-alpha-D-glucosylmutase
MGPEEAMRDLASGLPKLWLIQRALRLRGKHVDVFECGGYQPLYTSGAKADHALAFMRGERVITLAPRLQAGLEDGWQDTALALPEGAWRNVLTDERFAGGAAVPVPEILGAFPVALLESEPA